MVRKFKIYSEVVYNNDQTDNKLLSNRDFTVGDINSIIDCINKTTEEMSRNFIAIESAANFFGIFYAIKSFTIYITGCDDEVIETLTVNDFKELTSITDLIMSLCVSNDND